MKYSRTHVSDRDLRESMFANRGRERAVIADELADLAEWDARRLYLPAAHPSMHSYCVGELGYSEDEAEKRIQAARIARPIPVIFEMLADGRLNLTGVCLLAPHLTPENAGELLIQAAGKTNKEIRELRAQRFPRSELLAMTVGQPAAQQVDDNASEPGQHAAQHVERDGEPAAQQVEGNGTPAPQRVANRSQVQPLSSGSFGLYLCISRETHENLEYAQALASHQIPAGDVAAVFDRALKAWIRELEKTKFAATSRPGQNGRSGAAGERHIPAPVKRAVWERDGGQCAFVSETGQRCEAREKLEFDHMEAVARGGQATVDGMRLLCRAHNQYEAERLFGTDFMARKREQARAERAAAKSGRQVEAKRHAAANQPAMSTQVAEVVPWLRSLGFRAEEARNAAELCDAVPDASLEKRVRLALTYFSRRRSDGGLPVMSQHAVH